MSRQESSAQDTTPVATVPKKKSNRATHWLYISVIIAVVAGVIFGLVAPGAAKEVKFLGDMFIALIKMVIPVVIFCTIVIGIGHVREATTVGKAGGLALVYFIVMSTFALAIGLVVGNIIQPGGHLNIGADDSAARALIGNSEKTHDLDGVAGFVMDLIPTTLMSSLTGGSILQALFVALLVGFVLQTMPNQVAGPCLYAIELLQKVVFKIMSWILWVAPVGAFGAMAALIANSGAKAILDLLTLMLAFWITCIVFIVVILGTMLKVVTGLNIFKVLKYLGQEYLLILGTSSSESALPQLMQKMEFAGVDKATVGIVVPTGYSFNLDGTAIYLTMSAIFISDAMHMSMNIGEQIGLLVFMILASKGAAGVSGAGLATLAVGLESQKPELLAGVSYIQGIDKFMSEARSLTNFTGNAVATFLVGKWTKSLDLGQANAVLDGQKKFEYVDDDDVPEIVGANPQPAVQEPATEVWRP
ncbi:cation:dicarboxylate symporter family transporter [Corynebacterium provencense]|uniref:Aerobic C4-dicarboxylate transport protein n=1 Tax=Corynebacterium provencense TaxID=1737425 RepID=A0A2Z3YZZ7_9CORY|nr:cation:dicarboxylase symporter family transporter [Corynebacterium provencense]AWT26923.1 Aerobic C4-dicarboxylate transport protein [Corynebacterium provencense]